MTEKILITGALGQIGTELTVRLSEKTFEECRFCGFEY